MQNKQKHQKIKLFLGILLLMLVSFFLGYASNKAPQQASSDPVIIIDSYQNPIQPNQMFVASARGSLYYYPWCEGAQSLSEENKIFFSSKTEAEQAGYKPATNCPGL